MLSIDFPIHGAILNHRLGRLVGEGLAIEVRGRAPLGGRVAVNGVTASRAGTEFRAEVVLSSAENDIRAEYQGTEGQASQSVRVIWDRYSEKRYRFSIDDNSFFLREIARERPKSLFDHFYLGILRDLNRAYGAKFTVNVFFATPGNDFTMAEFPTDYRGEWADNGDWLRLAFHAYAEFPNRPYQNESPGKLAADFDLVAGEILRIAGEDAYAPPTVIHWGMCQAEALPVLRERGVKVLSGFFSRHGDNYDVSYHLDRRRCEHTSRHDAIMDWESGIVFSKVDIVCNSTPIEQIVPKLEPLTRQPETAEVMDLFTHEQYFFPFYRNYIPDHAQRLDTAIRFVTEQGYKPVFLHEGFMGGREPNAAN
jgi:hypothetical protein